MQGRRLQRRPESMAHMELWSICSPCLFGWLVWFGLNCLFVSVDRGVSHVRYVCACVRARMCVCVCVLRGGGELVCVCVCVGGGCGLGMKRHFAWLISVHH